jgi:hypothetical protein
MLTYADSTGFLSTNLQAHIKYAGFGTSIMFLIQTKSSNLGILLAEIHI